MEEVYDNSEDSGMALKVRDCGHGGTLAYGYTSYGDTSTQAHG